MSHESDSDEDYGYPRRNKHTEYAWYSEEYVESATDWWYERTSDGDTHAPTTAVAAALEVQFLRAARPFACTGTIEMKGALENVKVYYSGPNGEAR